MASILFCLIVGVRYVMNFLNDGAICRDLKKKLKLVGK
jgi:hypothetical protein